MKTWSDIIEDDLSWREAELASLKHLAIYNRDNPVVLRTTLRASWAILYAHYEGFTLFCWELLLDHVQNSKHLLKQLREDFALLSLEKSFRNLRGDLSAENLWLFYKSKLPKLLSQKAIFDKDCRLETQSNLWPNIYEKECARIGIKSEILDQNRTRIKTLVARRNDIAHGKNMIIKSIEEYSQYEQATLLVLHDLGVQVLDILEKESYKV